MNRFVNAGVTGLIPDPGRSRMMRSNGAGAPQLLKLASSRAREPQLRPCATTVEPVLQSQEPQLLKPHALEPMLCNKRSHHNEKPAHHN